MPDISRAIPRVEASSVGHTISHRLLWMSVSLASVLALIICYDVGTERLVVGSEEGGWSYRYLQPFRLSTFAVFLLASLVSVGLLKAEDGVAGRSEWRRILLWIVIGLGVQALLRSLTPFSFERIFASAGANSFYEVTRHYFAGTVLADFDRVRAYFPLHAQSNMPGKLMLVYLLRYISRRPDVLAWLVVILSNLGGVLLYVFVRDLSGDGRFALASLVLYLFVPAKLYFFPLLNTATPFFVLLCACLLQRWLMTGRPLYAGALGVSLYVLVFYEPLPLVMGLFFAALVARALQRKDIGWRTLLVQSSLVVFAFLVAYAAMYVLFGFDLMSAFRQISVEAIQFNAAAGRPYGIWIRENVPEFLFGVGVCQVVLVAVALADGLLRRDSSESRLTRPIVVICLGLLAVLAATDLIGVNRGEVIRLWIFLACLFQIPAAYVCARLKSRVALALVLVTTLLQDALGTAMIGFILPG